MRAMIFTTAGERLAEVAEPEVGAADVLLQVEYCGICGSDLHAGEPDFHAGVVMGHEFVGTVLEVGAEVSGWAVGVRVVVNPNGNWCGRCGECRRGATNLCPEVWKGAVGLAANGGLAPRAAVPARTLRLLPDGLSFRDAAWTEPLAVALRTVRRSEFSVGQDAVVLGGGPIGLLVTALLSAAGASSITLVEPTAARRQIAERLGATATVDPTETDVVDHFASMPSAPAYAFECGGVSQLTRLGVKILRPGGRLTVTGFSRTPPVFDAADLLFKEIDIRGSFIYRGEFEEAISILASGRIDVGALTTDVVSIDDAERAFSAMRTSTSAIKYLISAQHST